MAALGAKFEADAKALMAKVGEKFQPKTPGASSEEKAKQLDEDDLLHANNQEGNGYGVPDNFDNELDSMILGVKIEKPEGWGDKMPDKEVFEKWMSEQNDAAARQVVSQQTAIKQAVMPPRRRNSRSPHRPLK